MEVIVSEDINIEGEHNELVDTMRYVAPDETFLEYLNGAPMREVDMLLKDGTHFYITLDDFQKHFRLVQPNEDIKAACETTFGLDKDEDELSIWQIGNRNYYNDNLQPAPMVWSSLHLLDVGIREKAFRMSSGVKVEKREAEDASEPAVKRCKTESTDDVEMG